MSLFCVLKEFVRETLQKTITHGFCSAFGEVFGEVLDSKLLVQTSHKKDLSFFEKASG